MTGLLAAGQKALIGDRFLTAHTRSGLSHQVKGSITCWASGLRTGSSMGFERGNGTVVFFIEKQRVPWEGKEPMRGRPHHSLGGEGVGGPLPPP